MEFRDARTIDAATLYERRKQAILLHQSGMSYLEIAPKVGVHRNTVGQWVTAWKKGGQVALKVKSGGRPKGSGRKLYPHEEREIRKCLIDHCPDQLKLPFALWTRQAVQLLIRKRPASYMSASKSSRVPGELEKLCGKRHPIGRQQGFGLICRS